MGKTLTIGHVMIDRRSTRAYWVMSLCEETAQQLQQAYCAWSLRFRCQRAEVKAMSSHRSPCSVRNRRRVVVCIFAAQQHLAPSDGGRDSLAQRRQPLPSLERRDNIRRRMRKAVAAILGPKTASAQSRTDKCTQRAF